MKTSIQVNTGPTLKQFATFADDGELIVTSKLGASTISRVRFLRREYPAIEAERAGFIKKKVLTTSPFVVGMLGVMFERCINDQAKAVDQLLHQ